MNNSWFQQTRFILVTAIVGLVVIIAIAASNGSRRAPTAKATTVTSIADAFRRLELRGYSHEKSENVWGSDYVSYVRKTPTANYTATLGTWSGQNRLKELTFDCRTNEAGFKAKGKEFWIEMQRDVYAMIGDREDYGRAVDDLHPIEEGKDDPVLRHEGQATTADGWQIKVIEDVRHYIPQFAKPEVFRMRVGMISMTHVETDRNIPAAAVREFNDWVEKTNKNAKKIK